MDQTRDEDHWLPDKLITYCHPYCYCCWPLGGRGRGKGDTRRGREREAGAGGAREGVDAAGPNVANVEIRRKQE